VDGREHIAAVVATRTAVLTLHRGPCSHVRPLFIAVFLTFPLLAGCVRANPPTDTGDPVASTPTSPSSPTGPTTSDTTALAYNQDLKPLFQSDCVVCHGSSRADGNYRMTTYVQVMAAVRAGNASSTLVRVTQQNGNMYRYWTGTTTTRQAKAAAVRAWVVTFSAQENR
jgi:hypothetical protein